MIHVRAGGNEYLASFRLDLQLIAMADAIILI